MGRRTEDTRLRILSAAERQFAQSGYDATGVAELCRSAGVSKGAFYHHFASKHDLFLQLLDIWLATLDAAFAAAAEQADDVPTALRGMAELVAEGIRRPEQRLGMFVEFWAHAQRDPAIWRRAAEPYRRYLAYFERLIARGIEQRRFRQIAPERAATLLTSMALGLLMQATFAPDDQAWGDTLRSTLETFLESLEEVRR